MKRRQKDDYRDATSERNFGRKNWPAGLIVENPPLTSLSPICITTFSVVSGCIGGHNWTAYRPGTQFEHGGLGTGSKMHL